MIADAKAYRIRPVLEQDVHGCTGCMPAHVREGLLEDAIRAEVDAGRQRRRGALERERHGRPGGAGRLHQFVQAREARLRVARRLRLRVLAQDAEQPAHLRQRVARCLADRLEVRAGLLRQALDRQAGALGLHGDRRDVVSDDVVQVSGDACALAHRGLVLQRVDHRLPRLVALGERLAALAARVAERCRGDDHHQEQHAGKPASAPENGSMAFARNGSAGSTDQRRP